MRLILILWFIPLFLFWGWFALSANDVHMGSLFFSRVFHDHLMGIYGSILQIPAKDVPLAIGAVFAFDSVVIVLIAALRWYKKWMPAAWALKMDALLEVIQKRIFKLKAGMETAWKSFKPRFALVGSNKVSLSSDRFSKYLAEHPKHPAE